MARIVKGTGVEFPELKQIAYELREFPQRMRRKYMKAAFNAAARVGEAKVKQMTPKGPTGNLRRSIVKKATSGYGVAGYKRSPKKRDKIDSKKGTVGAQHAGLLEFGTKARKTKGRIASTFRVANRASGDMRIVTPKRGKYAGQLRTKGPNFPKSFFKSAPAGKKVDLKKMPVGGRIKKPPVKAAFEAAKSEITNVLRQQASTALARATKDLANRFPPKGVT